MAVYKLRTPISEEDVRRLKLGDVVYISGIMVTARDSAHRRAMELLRAGKSLPVDLRGGVLYHCGPVVQKVNEEWRVVAAGPTTSIRMEPFEADFIKLTGVRVIVGKGGMGADTTRACKEHGAVYTSFTGGCGALAANAIKRVLRVEWLDLGIPEALWVFEVQEFGPLVVTIDAHGNNFYERVSAEAERRKAQVYEMLGLR
ncbi:fumarate hydratase [Candidatus Bathyarchaeota archaeon]|nr:MAG: fumarate hydratase [Candidatus Bathyarchaeota archaeon]